MKPEVFEELIAAIQMGEPLRQAFARLGINSKVLDIAFETDPIKFTRYARAQKVGADLLASDIIHIADTEDDAGKARNMIDSRKWYASKMKPEVFGDRIDLNVSHSVDVAGALKDADTRYLSATQVPVTEVQGTDITNESSSLAIPAAPILNLEVQPDPSEVLS